MTVVATRGVVVHPDVDLHQVLGRKGLLGKDRATRLALCAVHRALGLPPGARPETPLDGTTAVVVASNLGNLETVHRVGEALDRGGIREVSPLDAPNASSNVVASSIAIWFRFGGPNLMVCSGATAGLDAVELGRLLLRSGRARRAVVVGVEPDDETALALCRREGLGLRSVAACVILERDAEGPRVSPVIGVPEASPAGDSYGAEGVEKVAQAVTRVAAGDSPSLTVTCGNPADGWRAARVERW